MTEPITAEQFHRASGVEDWRVLALGAYTYFRTGSFATGLELVGVIGELAEAMDHHPDLEMRYGGVSVRLFTHTVMGLTERDLELARQISAAARELEIPADPSAVQDVQLAVDALDRPAVMAFWSAVLGYDKIGDEDLVDPRRIGPPIYVQDLDVTRADRNRIHVDLFVPHDVASARIAAALAAGGRMVDDENAPSWWTLADPEGNEVDVATWQGRDVRLR